jgi:hypothetical protein
MLMRRHDDPGRNLGTAALFISGCCEAVAAPTELSAGVEGPNYIYRGVSRSSRKPSGGYAEIRPVGC